MRAIAIAATASGVGKTTFSVALIAALRRRGLAVAPFKVGPDFLDPLHLARAARHPCGTLDGWFLDDAANRAALASVRADVIVVEGMMGLHDGIDGLSDAGSTAALARACDLPTVLLVDASASARSAGATLLGFAAFDARVPLVAAVFTGVAGPAHLEALRHAALASGVPVLGGLPRVAALALPERHLGLAPPSQHPVESNEALLCTWLEAGVDVDALLALARPVAAAAAPARPPATEASVRRVRIAVARDAAFCFQYPHNLALLEAAGAELAFFSPLADRALPDGTSAVILGGGYPELHAARLADNGPMLGALRRFSTDGGLLLAECGGMMLLCEAILDGNARHAMAGVVPAEVRMHERLQAIGYLDAVAEHGPLAGQRARGQVFHHGAFVRPPVGEPAWRIRRASGGAWVDDGWQARRTVAGWTHTWLTPSLAERMVNECR